MESDPFNSYDALDFFKGGFLSGNGTRGVEELPSEKNVAKVTKDAEEIKENLVTGVVFAGSMTPVGRSAQTVVTVGRWMSQAELSIMMSSGRLAESTLGGITNVIYPARSAGYAADVAGKVYVEFNVAKSALNAVDLSKGWAKIWGPSSIFGKKLGISEMPAVSNIKVIK